MTLCITSATPELIAEAQKAALAQNLLISNSEGAAASNQGAIEVKQIPKTDWFLRVDSEYQMCTIHTDLNESLSDILNANRQPTGYFLIRKSTDNTMAIFLKDWYLLSVPTNSKTNLTLQTSELVKLNHINGEWRPKSDWNGEWTAIDANGGAESHELVVTASPEMIKEISESHHIVIADDTTAIHHVINVEGIKTALISLDNCVNILKTKGKK